MKKRILGILLCIVMCITLIPESDGQASNIPPVYEVQGSANLRSRLMEKITSTIKLTDDFYVQTTGESAPLQVYGNHTLDLNKSFPNHRTI